MIVEYVHDHPGVIVNGLHIGEKHVSEEAICHWQIAIDDHCARHRRSIYQLLLTMSEWAQDPEAIRGIHLIEEALAHAGIQVGPPIHGGPAARAGKQSGTASRGHTSPSSPGTSTKVQETGRQPQASGKYHDSAGRSTILRILETIYSDFPTLSGGYRKGLSTEGSDFADATFESGDSSGCDYEGNVPIGTESVIDISQWF